MTIEEVAAFALALPGSTEGVRHRHRTWFAGGRTAFAWERPLSKADVKRLGDAPAPAGPLVAVRVRDLAEKEVLMMQPPHGVFDIAHFSGYPAVLIQLDVAGRSTVQAALREA